jgi:hypothetical protein
VFVLVVAVTKVTIVSTLYLSQRRASHEREEEAAGRVTFVTLFFLKLNLRPPTPSTPTEGGVSAPSFQQPEWVRA